MCGELPTDLCRIHNQTGSSPRVWGTRTVPAPSQSQRRFIPACVGNSCCKRSHSVLTTVHPRVCGELKWSNSCSIVGSRFIPACVGNSSDSCSVLRDPYGSSPRVWGTLLREWVLTLSSAGSSPRVWGTHVAGGPFGRYNRFIPACVGNSLPQSELKTTYTVHPRVCGELLLSLSSIDPDYGSSPRVWGTRSAYVALRGRARFIPACVGNSLPGPTSVSSPPVHPRVCGELPS